MLFARHVALGCGRGALSCVLRAGWHFVSTSLGGFSRLCRVVDTEDCLVGGEDESK